MFGRKKADAERELFAPIKVPTSRYPWSFWPNAGLAVVNTGVGLYYLVTLNWSGVALPFGLAALSGLIALWSYRAHQSYRATMQSLADDQEDNKAAVQVLYQRYCALYSEQEAYLEFLVRWGAKDLEHLGIEPPKENSVGSS